MRGRTVRAGEVDLAVWDSGDPANPTVVLVHGFPDTHRLWDRVAARLVNRFHVVAYDVRGAGDSSAPAAVEGYCLDRLVDDLVAVLDDVVPAGKRVHLVGHDWGSTQLWDAVSREADDRRLTGRLASFTSISGPGLDYLACFFRSAWRQRSHGVLAQQALRSAYVGFFLLPGLPVPVLRLVAGPDGANGLNLYRANVPARMRKPRASVTRVPVQLAVLTRDQFLTGRIYADIGRWATRLERVDIDAGHWAPRTAPDAVATTIADFVGRVEAAPRTPG